MKPAQLAEELRKDVCEPFRGVFILHTTLTLLYREWYSPSCNVLCEVAKLLFPNHGKATSVPRGYSGACGISNIDLQYPVEWQQLCQCQAWAASLPLLENLGQ